MNHVIFKVSFKLSVLLLIYIENISTAKSTFCFNYIYVVPLDFTAAELQFSNGASTQVGHFGTSLLLFIMNIQNCVAFQRRDTKHADQRANGLPPQAGCSKPRSLFKLQLTSAYVSFLVTYSEWKQPMVK